MVALLVSMLALWGSGSASPQGKSSVNTRASGFWYPEMDHVGASRGYAPYADNATLYPVFQSIKPGDGGSIQAAIDSAVGRSRQDEWLASQPRVRAIHDVYFQ